MFGAILDLTTNIIGIRTRRFVVQHNQSAEAQQSMAQRVALLSPPAIPAAILPFRHAAGPSWGTACAEKLV